MHPLLQTVLLTVFVPAAVSGVVVLAASWVSPGRWRSGIVAAGLAAAWCVGVWLAVRTPRWPAAQAADWQFYAVVLAGAAVLIMPLFKDARAWRWLAGAAFFVLFFALLLQRVLAGLWPGAGAFVWPLGLAGLAMVNAGAAARIGHSVHAAWTFFALLVFSVLMAVLLTLSGSAALGHSAGILASACGGAWVVSWALRRQVDFGPAAFVAAVVLAGLLVQGLFLGGLDWRAALLMAAAWPGAAVVCLVAHRATGVVRAAAATVMIAVVGAGALLLASR